MGTLNTFSQVKEPGPFLWLMTNQGTFMPRRHWTEKREPSTHWWLRRWTGTPTDHWNHHQNSLSRSRTLMTTLRSFYMKPIMPMCLRGRMWVCKLGSPAPLLAGVFAGGQAGSCPPSSEPESVLHLYCLLTRKKLFNRIFSFIKNSYLSYIIYPDYGFFFLYSSWFIPTSPPIWSLPLSVPQ